VHAAWGRFVAPQFGHSTVWDGWMAYAIAASASGSVTFERLGRAWLDPLRNPVAASPSRRRNDTHGHEPTGIG